MCVCVCVSKTACPQWPPLALFCSIITLRVHVVCCLLLESTFPPPPPTTYSTGSPSPSEFPPSISSPTNNHFDHLARKPPPPSLFPFFHPPSTLARPLLDSRTKTHPTMNIFIYSHIHIPCMCLHMYINKCIHSLKCCKPECTLGEAVIVEDTIMRRCDSHVALAYTHIAI